MTRDVIKTDEAEETIQSLDMVAGRRAFVKALGFGAVGAAVFGAAAGTVTPAAAAFSDTQILNFALNLEYLESAFYSFAATGKDISASLTTGVGTGGGLSGGAKVKFSSRLVKAYSTEIAEEELRHVEVLRAVLGADAVARPAINIGTAFQAAATAAGIPGTFDAYTNDTTFLIASYIFEDVGVTAYHGAAGLIQNPTYLNYAAGILAVEAYHAGIIRTALLASDFASGTTTAGGITAKISALRSQLANGMGNTMVDDVGIGSIGAPTVVDVDAPNATMFNDIAGGDAIAYARTPGQVLNIVYGSFNGTPGLFFPSGINLGAAAAAK